MKKLEIRKPKWMRVKNPVVRGIIGTVIFLAVAIPIVLASFYGVGRSIPLVVDKFENFDAIGWAWMYTNPTLPIIGFWANVVNGIDFAVAILEAVFMAGFLAVAYYGAILFVIVCIVAVICTAGCFTGNFVFNGSLSVQSSE